MTSDRESSAWRITAATVLTGGLIGVVGGLFLKTLALAEATRIGLVELATRNGIPGWLAAMVAGLVGAAAGAWLATRYAPDAPQSVHPAGGDGSVAATSEGAALTVNFAGTGLAIGAGLALGPERPAIQMGGAIGRIVSRVLGLGPADRERLVAATGGAGVATMFNAPLGCAAYTVERVLGKVDLRISLLTLGAGAVAVAVARLLIGRDVNFVVAPPPPVAFGHLFLHLLLGGMIAVFAFVHGHLVRWVSALLAPERVPSLARGAIVGAIAGCLVGFAPNLAGTGDALTQQVLDGGTGLSALGLFFVVRLLFGPLSLGAGTPGGYFTPVLLLGALSGATYGIVLEHWFPAMGGSPTGFAVVGMAVALATVARAPFTGILLVMETTGVFRPALSMIVAVIGAVAMARLMRTPSFGTGLKVKMKTLAKP